MPEASTCPMLAIICCANFWISASSTPQLPLSHHQQHGQVRPSLSLQGQAFAGVVSIRQQNRSLPSREECQKALRELCVRTSSRRLRSGFAPAPHPAAPQTLNVSVRRFSHTPQV